ncbi:MAG: hypothetical protein QOJ42_210, partial [Acidobacteriaceae bacterium]|nr:hypothetical protein [Acidobacteriaceae bacterium]
QTNLRMRLIVLIARINGDARN